MLVIVDVSRAYPDFNSKFRGKLVIKKRIFICFLILVLVSVALNTYIQSRSEFLVNYNFKVSKIEISPTRSLTVYDNDKKIDFWNFSIREGDSIKIGDHFFKDSCSQYLYIYRRDGNGIEELYMKIRENGIFPYEWFCS